LCKAKTLNFSHLIWGKPEERRTKRKERNKRRKNEEGRERRERREGRMKKEEPTTGHR
jgi:hypothetical protein